MAETIVEMTLTEALLKKKTYLNRINDLTCTVKDDTTRLGRKSGLSVVACKQGEENSKIYNIKDSLEEFETSSKAYVQKVLALINNYTSLCKAISKANNETIVTIGGKDMTISEAVALKKNDVFSLEAALCKKIAADYDEVFRFVSINNEKHNAQESINNYLTTILSDVEKADKDKVSVAIDMYHKKYDFVMIDPLNSKVFIEETYNRLQSFKDEVDFRLAEVNSRTMIKVSYED